MNILITGGSSGLGRALVERLASNLENKISFTYCSNESSAKELMCKYSNVSAYQVDFRKTDSVVAFTEQLAISEVEALINNAYSGKAQGTHFHKTDISDFEVAFNNNILPTIMITQACLNGMRKRKYGKIINIITSYVMDVPPAGFSVYASTKAYIRQLSKSISKEYGRYNITSNCILPDYMSTPFGKVAEFQLEQMITAHPLKKLLQPEEVADVIVNVLKASQQLNGVEIPINAAQHIL